MTDGNLVDAIHDEQPEQPAPETGDQAAFLVATSRVAQHNPIPLERVPTRNRRSDQYGDARAPGRGCTT